MVVTKVQRERERIINEKEGRIFAKKKNRLQVHQEMYCKRKGNYLRAPSIIISVFDNTYTRNF